MRRGKAAALAGAAAAVLLVGACSAGTGVPGAVDAGGAAGGSAAASAETVFRVAFNQPENHPQFIAMQAMGERLAERTGGRYGIEVYPNETLGAQRETIELVQSGALDMSMVASPLLENFNPDFVAFNLPFTFDSQDHQRQVANDPAIVSELYSSLDGQNIHVLAAFHGGVRSMYNPRGPITTPADLAGMKVRVIESDTNIAMIRLMGGSGTPMGMGEVYTALQSGVIDAAENNELTYFNSKHSEVAPYYSYTRHLMLPDYLIINPAVLAGMSPEHRTIFTEEVRAAVEEEGQLWKTEIARVTQAAKDAGAQFNEVDTTAFAAAIRPLVEQKLTSDVARRIHEQARAAATAG
ncbi:tripartite ATP-independent transporter DctP family solute receptor [Pseudonocardia hierapolitana]|uniref:Tripartite ATP-independent transporter DctP family solute receptor n=1 Tax=Pseudonocardia hierapolitana TaxID=1128676 RepID=A0A561SID4_9PSEU|nr:TRAP transporter substrate-binding protein [Pseudonocardia hierapolitana]TWF74648.1 tripartite ATP-independent transporter DctP family solute receptor [Pseudonocardia hierapolitana]